MQRITVLSGAGASCPFGYPTTKQFFDKIKVTDQLQELLFNSIKQMNNVKDIEHVLDILDNLIDISSSSSTANFLTSIVEDVKLFNTVVKWQKFIEKCTELKSTIIDKIYSEYHFRLETRNDAFKAIDDLLNVLNTERSFSRSFFTLNYDRVLEEYFIERRIPFVDGFSFVNQRRLWNPQTFDVKDPDEGIIPSDLYSRPSVPFRVFKLHGSLSWREFENTIECTTTEEPARSSYHKRNVFIYPTESCNESKEPYRTLYANFRRLKETTDILLVIGYAFRDELINVVIRDFVQQNRESRVIIVSPGVHEDIRNLYTDSAMKTFGHKMIMEPGKFPETQTIKQLSEYIKAVDERTRTK